MFTKHEVDLAELPIFMEYKCIYPNKLVEFDIDWWTASELKGLFGITLTKEEKETKIQAFKHSAGYRGFAAVYSKQEILDSRLIPHVEA